MNPNDLNKLHGLLSELHVPDTRRDVSQPTNVRWLLRNIGINNASGLALTETIRLLLLLHRSNIKRDL